MRNAKKRLRDSQHRQQGGPEIRPCRRSDTIYSRLSISLILVLLVAVTAVVRAAPINSIFQPDDYTTSGSLSLSSGTLSFDTDTPSYSHSGGSSGSGVTDTSQGGGVELAIFAFDDIDITSGVTVNVTGDRGIVLASKGDIDFGATMNVNGTDGDDETGVGSNDPGLGAPGAEGGMAGSSFSSASPPANAGDGGEIEGSGVGYGAGTMVAGDQSGHFAGGQGGGYGGAGGAGFVAAAFPNGGAGVDPGVVYGDELLTELYGGSGGSGSNKQSHDDFKAAPGGGGGGAVELTANGTINLSGVLEAMGGAGGDEDSGGLAGGGGSGGGILLNADTVNILGTGAIDASGGDAGVARDLAGAGGGGRVSIFYRSGYSLNGTIDVAGGSGGRNDGGDGTVSVTPEPTSLFLLALGMLAALWRRRR
jgi:hypothetical protein